MQKSPRLHLWHTEVLHYIPPEYDTKNHILRLFSQQNTEVLIYMYRYLVNIILEVEDANVS